SERTARDHEPVRLLCFSNVDHVLSRKAEADPDEAILDHDGGLWAAVEPMHKERIAPGPRYFERNAQKPCAIARIFAQPSLVRDHVPVVQQYGFNLLGRHDWSLADSRKCPHQAVKSLFPEHR